MTRYDGKTTRRKLKKIQLSEISLVDAPAHAPARVALLKRRTEKYKAALTTQTGGHAHSIALMGTGGDMYRMGSTSYVDGHAHDWVMDDAGNIVLADAMGHTHGISVLTKNEPTIAAKDGTDNMNPDQIAAELKKAEQTIVELRKDNARLASIAALTKSERDYFDTLSTESQRVMFLEQSAADRAQLAKSFEDDNTVVYTALDGTVYKKRDDVRLVAQTKRGDEAEKRERRTNAVLRAGTELANLSGENTVKADLLEAIDLLPEDRRAPVLALVKSHDAGLGAAFQRVGTTDGKPEGDTPTAKLDALTKQHAAKHNVSEPEAMVAVLDTPEGRELYAAMRA